MTTAEVALLLRSSEETVRRLADEGEIGGVQLGRQYRFLRRHIERLAGLEVSEEPDWPEVLKRSEAGDFLRLSEQTVSELVQSGALPAFRIGGEWRFSRNALEALFPGAEEEGP